MPIHSSNFADAFPSRTPFRLLARDGERKKKKYIDIDIDVVVVVALTLRAFCLTMTTYLCTRPFATSARATRSVRSASPAFAPSKPTRETAAARGVTTRRVVVALLFAFFVVAVSAAPDTVALARIASPPNILYERKSSWGRVTSPGIAPASPRRLHREKDPPRLFGDDGRIGDCLKTV